MSRVSLARAWIGFGVLALLLSGALSILVTGAKMPGVRSAVNLEMIRWCLVAHVNLATLVWFTAIPVGLLHLAETGDRSGASKVPRVQVASLVVAAFGVLLTLLAGVALPNKGFEPILANYIPVVRHPQYLAGLLLYGVGAGLSFLSQGLKGPRISAPVPGIPGLAECRFGAWIGTVYYLGAIATLVGAMIGMRDLGSLPSKTYYEILMWGSGHLLQHFSVVFLVIGWIVLLSNSAGRPVLTRGQLFPVFAWLGLPIFALPLLVFAFAPSSNAYREGFTHLMRWGIFPPVLFLIARSWRAAAHAPAGFGRSAVAWSAFLIGIGFIFGALIRGPDLRVPAHYHATIGAVTVAFMALSYVLLRPDPSKLKGSDWIGRAIRTYGSGQTLFAGGMFVAGSFGLGRKTYGTEISPAHPGQYVGLAVMAAGGLLALAGGILFARAIVPVLRDLLQPIQRRMFMRPAYIVAGAILGAVVLSLDLAADAKSGAKGGGSVMFPPSTPELVAKGKSLYSVNCLSCHGPNADGNGPAGQYLKPKPRNLAADPFKKGDRPESIFSVVTAGLPGTAMTAFGHLKEEERWALTHYVLSLRKK